MCENDKRWWNKPAEIYKGSPEKIPTMGILLRSLFIFVGSLFIFMNSLFIFMNSLFIFMNSLFH